MHSKIELHGLQKYDKKQEFKRSHTNCRLKKCECESLLSIFEKLKLIIPLIFQFKPKTDNHI